MLYADFYSLLEDVFNLLIFVRKCLEKRDTLLGFGLRHILSFATEHDFLLLYCGDLVDDLRAISRKEDDLIANLRSENTSELMKHLGIREGDIDREWECDEESLHIMVV